MPIRITIWTLQHLWKRSGRNLRHTQLAKWEETISNYRVSGEPPERASILGDMGTDARISDESAVLEELEKIDDLPNRVERAFVKFFGEGNKRSDRSERVIDEVNSSESHWACTFPKGKRPRMVKDGAIIYMARMVKDPNDILIYGRAIGMQHLEGRDDATDEDMPPQQNLWVDSGSGSLPSV